MKEKIKRTGIILKGFTMLIGIAMLLFILTFMGGCSMFDAGKTDEIQKNMTDYLKNTYGKDFVVGKPKISGNEFIGFSNYIADAYPKDEPDLKFGVIWNKNKPDVFQDGYLGSKWSKQGTVEMEKKLKKVYGNDFLLKKYWISYNDRRVKDLDYPEIIKKYADKMEVKIYYFVFIDAKLDKKYEAERAYKILKENLIDLKTMQYSFSVVYVLKEKRSALDKVYSKTKEGDYERGTKALLETGIAKDSTGTYYSKALSEKYPEKYPEIKNADDLMPVVSG
ncbi:MAG: hypothetical protein HY957_04055 [Nitrospirae bacterium]|nr:hypothetical protein [Nitrospirota bacterium]